MGAFSTFFGFFISLQIGLKGPLQFARLANSLIQLCFFRLSRQKYGDKNIFVLPLFFLRESGYVLIMFLAFRGEGGELESMNEE